MEVSVPDVPRCINYVPENFVLKSLYYGYVARFCASSQLYAIGPQRLQYLFVKHQLCVDRADLLPMSSKYMCLYFRPSSSLCFLTCTFQRSLASRVMPRCFAVWECGMVLPFIMTGIWWYLSLVKVTWIDLSSLSLISYCRVQLFISSAALCNFSVASTTSPSTAMMAVTSATVPSGWGRSLA